MSIFNKMISDYNVWKQGRNERKADEEYINDCLPNHHKNSYYMMCGNCDVHLRNPQKHLLGKKEPVYLETDNIPTYVINFSTLEKAQHFMENNFFMGPEHQKSVRIDIVSTVLSSAIIIKPTNIDYNVHIEVDSEEVGKKLVKMFRRQYIDEKNLPKLKEKKELMSQKAESEIEKLGIEF